MFETIAADQMNITNQLYLVSNSTEHVSYFYNEGSKNQVLQESAAFLNSIICDGTSNTSEEFARHDLGISVYPNPFVDILNIKNGSTVKVQVAIQDNIPGGAINKELTMMSYNESKNIWNVEGKGMAENGFYTAELPHFSTWTWCEIFSNPVNLSGKINLLNQGVPYFGKTYVRADYGIISFRDIPSDEGFFFLP